MLAIEKEVKILARNQYNDGFKINKMASGKRQDRPSIIKECVNESLMEGVMTAMKAGAIASSVVLLAHHFHKGFRTNVGVSGKVATVMMPLFGSFILTTEHSVSACRRRQQEFERSMRKLKG